MRLLKVVRIPTREGGARLIRNQNRVAKLFAERAIKMHICKNSLQSSKGKTIYQKKVLRERKLFVKKLAQGHSQKSFAESGFKEFAKGFAVAKWPVG